jgi:hypothetical protein
MILNKNKFIPYAESEKYGSNYIGQIVRILDKYSIVVSTFRALKEGNTVQVFDVGEELIGLDGESLGDYIYVKATLTVSQVESKYCICEAVTEEKVKPLLLTPFTDMARTVKSQQPLSVRSEDIHEVPKIDMMIKIGDKVRLQ